MTEWSGAGRALRAAAAALTRALARLPVLAEGLERGGEAGGPEGGAAGAPGWGSGGVLEALGAKQVSAAGRLAERVMQEVSVRFEAAGEVRRCARAARDVLRAELPGKSLPAEGTPERQLLRDGGGGLPSALEYLEGLEEAQHMLENQAELEAAVARRFCPGLPTADVAELLGVLEEEPLVDWGRLRHLLDLGLAEVDDI